MRGSVSSSKGILGHKTWKLTDYTISNHPPNNSNKETHIKGSPTISLFKENEPESNK